MNREKKFRAWDKHSKRFISDGFSIDMLGMYVTTARDQILRVGELVELNQYTGLKDKKGKEGYHKDIVRGLGKLWTIEWQDEEARFWLAPAADNTRQWRMMDELSSMEIIGNIYENIELLSSNEAGNKTGG